MAHKSLRYGCCQVYQQKPNNKFNGHEYVDLGLPSGTLWAKMNVGAESETDNGLYFAWGETTGYPIKEVDGNWIIDATKQFSVSDYAFADVSTQTITKYNYIDSKTHLELTDDAASVNMGGDWHMPNEAQCFELFRETKNGFVTNVGAFTEYYWSTANNLNPTETTATINGWDTAGYFFFKNTYTSVTEAITAEDYLFIPAAGGCGNGGVYDVGDGGYVWGSALDSQSVMAALCLFFNSDMVSIQSESRAIGQSVRGVVGRMDEEESQPEAQHLIQKDEVGCFVSNQDGVTYLIVGTGNSGGSKKVKMDNHTEYRYAIVTDKNAIGMSVADAYSAGYITMGDEVPSDDTDAIDMTAISSRIIHNAVPGK